MILAVACDICLSNGEGTVEDLGAAGWHIESVTLTPHVCPDCVPAMQRDLSGSRAG
jgi:hypothetical protein